MMHKFYEIKTNLISYIRYKNDDCRSNRHLIIHIIYSLFYNYFLVGVAVANAASCSTAPLLAITFAP